MKYLFIVGDGMADEPVPSLGNRTPLEAARIPNMHRCAKQGVVGVAKTIPEGLPPGSDVANLSLLGFDPRKYYTGRGPLEAASMGISLQEEDCAFRCNLVNVQGGKMNDYSSGHISTDEAQTLISALNASLSRDGVRFYPGVDYRHICVLRGSFHDCMCTPPHDISGKHTSIYFPKGQNQDIVRSLMYESIPILEKEEVNRRRLQEGKLPATQIWLWGQGYKPGLVKFEDAHGVSGSVITAVDLIRGIGVLAGLEVIRVEGATGFVDTNYEGKAHAAISALQSKDFVFVHVEAPDETGHQGNAELKVKAIEDFDSRLLGSILPELRGDYRMIIMPDHPTPIRTKTHSPEPVPFILYGSGVVPNHVERYSERMAKDSGVVVEKGHQLIEMLFERR